MDISVSVVGLKRGLSAVEGTLQASRSNPVTGFVLISGEDNRLTLRAQSWAREAEVRMEAAIKEAGLCALPCDVLAKVVAGLPESVDVRLKREDTIVLLTCGKSRYRLGLIEAEDYPAAKTAGDEHSFELAAADLVALLRASAYAATLKDSRIWTGGACLHVAKSGQLAAVGADGGRLGLRELPGALPGDIPSLVIPLASANEIIRLLASETGTITLCPSPSQLTVLLSGLRFTTQLLDTQYPDYARIVPQANGTGIIAGRDDLLAAAERALGVLTTANRDAPPTGRFEMNGSGLTLRCGPKASPLAHEEIAAEKMGEPPAVSMNLGWLCEMLSLWPADSRVEMHVSEPGKAILFTSQSVPEMRHVVMPSIPKGSEL